MLFKWLFFFQDGATPLILAAQMSRVELCVFLLARGANANLQDSQGRYWTAVEKRSEIFHFFLFTEDYFLGSLGQEAAGIPLERLHQIWMDSGQEHQVLVSWLWIVAREDS